MSRVGCCRLRRNRQTPVRAAPAYSGRTGLQRPRRATEVREGGSPGRSSRRGWRAEGLEARERESSSEPRPGWPRRTSGETAGLPPEPHTTSQTAGELMSRAGCCRLRRNRQTPVRAAPAYSGRTGLQRPHRATEVREGGSPGRSSRRGWRAEGLEARERESSSEPRPGWPRRTSGETAGLPPEPHTTSQTAGELISRAGCCRLRRNR